MTKLQRLINATNDLHCEYLIMKARLDAERARTFKYCKYQGCNMCINTNGLVPKEHKFAGELGPNDIGRRD